MARVKCYSVPIITPLALFYSPTTSDNREWAIVTTEKEGNVMLRLNEEDCRATMGLEDLKMPQDAVVLVALNKGEVQDILNEERHEDWVCSLRRRCVELVESGDVDVKKEYVVTGHVYFDSVSVTGTIDARNEDSRFVLVRVWELKQVPYL